MLADFAAKSESPKPLSAEDVKNSLESFMAWRGDDVQTLIQDLGQVVSSLVWLQQYVVHCRYQSAGLGMSIALLCFVQRALVTGESPVALTWESRYDKWSTIRPTQSKLNLDKSIETPDGLHTRIEALNQICLFFVACSTGTGHALQHHAYLQAAYSVAADILCHVQWRAHWWNPGSEEPPFQFGMESPKHGK